MNELVAIYTSVLVGFFNPGDIWHEQAVGVFHKLEGETNKGLNDALIALACKAGQIQTVATFDHDFDLVTWVKRVHF